MAKVFIQEDTLQGIADAIRGKNGSSDTYTPLQMATAIQDLSGGSTLVGYRLPYDENNTTGLSNTLVINWTSGTGYEESVYVAYTDNNYESCNSQLTSGSNTFTILAGSWFSIYSVGWFYGNESGWVTSVSTTSTDPYQIISAFTRLAYDKTYPFYNESPTYQTLFLQETPNNGTAYYNQTITINVHTNTSPCFLKGTKITLADGTYKNCEDITFDDELLVWDFDNGCFASAKPMFIKKPETTNKYVKLTFDDRTSVCYTGHRGYHRIFNEQAGMFTSTKLPETPIGTITFKDDSSRPKLISKEIVNENCEYYNIITDRHYNCFTNGILSSCKISNTHPIIDMKYTDIVSLDETFVKEYLEKIKNNPIWIKK